MRTARDGRRAGEPPYLLLRDSMLFFVVFVVVLMGAVTISAF
jgi:hypothetical protein